MFTCQEHKEKGQKFANRAVINIYFNNKRILSNYSVMKYWKHLKKIKRKIVPNKVKTLKEISFQKCEICFLEAATETCFGK